MRSIRRIAFRTLLAALALLAVSAVPPRPAAAKNPAAAKSSAQPQGEPIEISGRIAAGMDKVFIKDAQGYILVQGLDLAPFAGRNIQAKGLVIRRDEAYRTVRLLEYRIASPDDDSPGAGGEVRQTGEQKKRKK
jgi:hypothetical protein